MGDNDSDKCMKIAAEKTRDILFIGRDAAIEDIIYLLSRCAKELDFGEDTPKDVIEYLIKLIQSHFKDKVNENKW